MDNYFEYSFLNCLLKKSIFELNLKKRLIIQK